MPQRASRLISEAVAPSADWLGAARGPSGSTCGLISPPTWESAHSLNERGKKKTVCRCQPRPAPQTCTAAPCSGTVTQRPHAEQRAAAGRRRGRTDVQPESCASDGLRPSLFRLPLPFSSSFLLAKPSHFFFTSPQRAFCSLLPSPPCFLSALSS